MSKQNTNGNPSKGKTLVMKFGGNSVGSGQPLSPLSVERPPIPGATGLIWIPAATQLPLGQSGSRCISPLQPQNVIYMLPCEKHGE